MVKSGDVFGVGVDVCILLLIRGTARASDYFECVFTDGAGIVLRWFLGCFENKNDC
jgi:hypothetical protein